MSTERILEKQGINYKPVGNSFQVRCLSPDHVDNNPSMFINKYTGWANCRACGASYNIFELFNEKPNALQIRKDKFRELLRKKASESTFMEFPETTVLWKSDFRGVSRKTLEHFEAFQCADFPGYICFPIRNASGKIVNFIGRDTTGTRTPKYLLFDKKPVLMYPRHNARMGSIILVEGLFDMLSLYDKGIYNSRAVFGTTTLVTDKSKLTLSGEKFLEAIKMEGIDEVVIMFDGDDSGKNAAERLKQILDDEFISNKVVTLPSGIDPGELDQKTVNKIKEQLYGKNCDSRDKAIQN